MKLLLDRGVDLNARDEKINLTPIMWASKKGHQKVVELLLEKGADVNARCERTNLTPLIWAS